MKRNLKPDAAEWVAFCFFISFATIDILMSRYAVERYGFVELNGLYYLIGWVGLWVFNVAAFFLLWFAVWRSVKSDVLRCSILFFVTGLRFSPIMSNLVQLGVLG